MTSSGKPYGEKLRRDNKGQAEQHVHLNDYRTGLHARLAAYRIAARRDDSAAESRRAPLSRRPRLKSPPPCWPFDGRDRLPCWRRCVMEFIVKHRVGSLVLEQRGRAGPPGHHEQQSHKFEGLPHRPPARAHRRPPGHDPGRGVDPERSRDQRRRQNPRHPRVNDARASGGR